jgi:AcrR family transcriptional regulator
LASTKERILDTTAELFRRYGYTGTGLKQIVAQANAPFGSIYHFFPGGKEQLGGQVIRRSGQMYQDLLTSIIDSAPDLLTGIGDCFAGAAVVLRETDYADACPIETVALEVASCNELLREATADVFGSWIAAGTERLTGAGIAPRTARELAISTIALLEGAFVLSRAQRSVEPLEAAGKTATSVLRQALETAGAVLAGLSRSGDSPSGTPS